MQKVSVSLEDRHLEVLDEVDADNRSASLRTVLDEYRELQERVDELQDEVDQAEARADDLRRQLREANRREDDVQELANYVERERRREREREEAAAWTRAKWWLFGRDVDE